MTRKQARRKKQKKALRFSMPRFRLTHLVTPLIEHCRAEIAHYKCPRSIDFATDLPRTETGKLQKRHIKQQYWQGRDSLIS